jgi:hypothetical protein
LREYGKKRAYASGRDEVFELGDDRGGLCEVGGVCCDLEEFVL